MNPIGLLRRISFTAISTIVLGVSVVGGTQAGAGVSETPAAAASVSTAADGRIAFVRRHQIFSINPDGTGLTQLTNGGAHFAPTWSPDGTKIAYTHRDAAGARNLWIMDADGSNPTQVTTAGRVSTGGAGWSPNGSSLAFGGPCLAPLQYPRTCRYSHRSTVLDTVSVVPLAVPVTLLGDTDHDGLSREVMHVDDRVSWASTRDELTFASDSYSANGCDSFILVYRLVDGFVDAPAIAGCAGLNGTFANPIFSPDGQLLAYDTHLDAQGDITEGITVGHYPPPPYGNLFRYVAGDIQLAFAPTQSRVALVRDLLHDRIILADADGTDRTRLTRGTQPSWQPVP